MKPLEYKTQHHPTTSSTLCRTPHLNNKQKKPHKPNHQRQNYHLTQPCPSEEKQTNKNSAQISPYMKLTQTTGPTLGGQKPKGRKTSILKPGKVQFSHSVMSDSVRPHRQQPTRLPRPWDSPGKNTGVGCHFLLQCRKVKSESEVAQSCLTSSDPMDCNKY